MKFLDYDLGQCSEGQVVEVTLAGDAANVSLMDDPNLRSFRAGRRSHRYGVHATHSTVRLKIPHGGAWHLVVDHGGRRGNTRASVRVLPR